MSWNIYIQDANESSTPRIFVASNEAMRIHNQEIEEKDREISFLKEEIELKDEVFLWLLGYYTFPEHGENPGAYYWRKPLRNKLKEIGFDPNERYEALAKKEGKGETEVAK